MRIMFSIKFYVVMIGVLLIMFFFVSVNIYSNCVLYGVLIDVYEYMV